MTQHIPQVVLLLSRCEGLPQRKDEKRSVSAMRTGKSHSNPPHRLSPES